MDRCRRLGPTRHRSTPCNDHMTAAAPGRGTTCARSPRQNGCGTHRKSLYASSWYVSEPSAPAPLSGYACMQHACCTRMRCAPSHVRPGGFPRASTPENIKHYISSALKIQGAAWQQAWVMARARAQESNRGGSRHAPRDHVLRHEAHLRAAAHPLPSVCHFAGGEVSRCT